MKRLHYISALCVAAVSFIFQACDQEIDYPYQGKDRIQFSHYTTDYNSVRHYSDSIVYSFGLKPDDIHVDTAKVVIELLGRTSDSDRHYRVEVIADSTNAVAGVHYEAIDEEQVFRAGRINDTLRIVVHRDNLSTSFVNPVTTRLDLRLVPSEDFDLGLEGGITKKILLNNYLSEPLWWSGSLMSLGYYHPKKWKILMSFNDKYANYDSCPFDVNNEGRQYRQGLINYLNSIPTFDDETGARLYLDRMEMEE